MSHACRTNPPRRNGLEPRLERYARTAEGVLRAAGGAAKRWAPTTAAAGAALVMAPAADAAIIYSGIQNLTLTHGSSSSALLFMSVDLDGASGVDVRVGLDFDGGSSTGNFQPYLTALTSVQGIRASFGSVANLGFGAVIGSTSIAAGYTYPYLYQFAGTTGYAGVRFNIGGQAHFAWLRIAVSANGDTVTVIDWAYQDQPNTPVNAGALAAPEPHAAALGGLGLLALGAKGVLHRRRRLAELAKAS
jgi:hypothetical protein